MEILIGILQKKDKKWLLKMNNQIGKENNKLDIDFVVKNKYRIAKHCVAGITYKSLNMFTIPNLQFFND